MKAVFFLVLALAGVTGAARADVITEQATLVGAFHDFGEADYDFNNFDTQLGTLTSVSVSVNYTADDLFSLEAATSGPLVGYFNTYANVNILGGGVLGNLPSPQSIPENLVFEPPPPFYDFNVVVDFSGSGTFNVAQGDLVNFETRPNNLLGAIDLTAFANIAPGQAFSNAVDPDRNSTHASIIITYTYDPAPVPEPPSLALFSVGILGLFAASRRGRPSAQ